MTTIFSKTWFKIFLTVILLCLVFYQVNLENLLNKISNINYYLLFLALTIFIISNIAGTYSWFHIIRAKNKTITRHDIFSSYWKGLFFNLILPTGIGGDVVKAADIIKRYKKTYFLVSTILFDRTVNFFILECMGITAFFIYFQYWNLLTSLSLSLVVLVVTSLFFYRLFLFKLLKLSRWIQKKNKIKLINNTLRSIIILKYVLSDRKRLLYLIVSAFISQFLKVLVTYIVATALNFNLHVIASFFVVTVQTTVALIPITINGVGLREFSNNLFEGLPGISVTELSLTSLMAFFLLVLSSLPGVYFFFDNKQKSHSPDK